MRYLVAVLVLAGCSEPECVVKMARDGTVVYVTKATMPITAAGNDSDYCHVAFRNDTLLIVHDHKATP